MKLKNLPVSSGVYMFRDRTGKIVYIGKARNLRNRVRTYFQSSRNLDNKTVRMVSKVVDVDLMVTDSEVEALILEANLIHEHKPRYNIDLRDDKHFPYVKITVNEPFPRVLIVRRLAGDKARYFGPYTNAKAMRKTVALLTQLFMIRSCNLTIPHPTGKKHKLCLDYYIKRCGGVCQGLQTEDQYRELVDSVVMVLSGRSKKLIERLTTEMSIASEAMEYEKAARIRDQIEAVRAVMIKQHVDVGEPVDRDVIAIARKAKDALVVVMQIREGVLIGRQDFQLTADVDDVDESLLETFIKQYYNHQPNLPDGIFLPYNIPDMRLLAKWLKGMKGSAVEVHAPKAGGKAKLLNLASANAQLLLNELLTQKRGRSARVSKMVTSLMKQLGLTDLPRRIICFDISNTGETDAVGSCVYFKNGKPRKSGYRHFRIKSVVGQDDYKMMREVISRHFRRIGERKETPPDLVVVDGGKGQLSSALAELKVLGFSNQSVIGLAKRLEEVYLPNVSDPITIDRRSPALMLLKRVRDEAHRFAVTYNRKIRSRRTIISGLDGIPGIGPARRELLLREFGSVKRIREASVRELTGIKGISTMLAQRILDQL